LNSAKHRHQLAACLDQRQQPIACIVVVQRIDDEAFARTGYARQNGRRSLM
jgi:hypothetical protein